jgi:uncharacterized repeat protein (TIGR03803 family)
VGGASADGAVFKLSKFGKETVLLSFEADGGHPDSGAIRDAQGNLYGTTIEGTVYKLSESGKETVLHRFTGGADGGEPYAGVIRDSKGNLYGTTLAGGGTGCNGYGCGVIFKVSTTGKETVLYSFSGGADGGGHPRE